MPLPNFIVIGVAKAGTTSLYRYLDQHPAIYMCPDKGTNFFGYEDARDWVWTDEGDPPLLRNFHVHTLEEYERAFAGAEDETAVGEVSPQYFRCPTAARRIREAIPHAKLIASLRNPVDRAFSGYLMRRRRGEVVTSAHEDLTPDAGHVKEGFYYRRLKRFYDEFPREQINVFLFDELARDTQSVLSDVFAFLDVDTAFAPETPRYNRANVPRSRRLNRVLYHPAAVRTAKTLLPSAVHDVARKARMQNQKPPPTLTPDLRARLQDVYREDILRLETLIDRDLSRWLASP